MFLKQLKVAKGQLLAKDEELQAMKTLIDIYISDQEKMKKEILNLNTQLRIKIADIERE